MKTATAKTKKVTVRAETTRQRPETTSREGKIQMLVGAGLGNVAIWAALEHEYPEIIPDGDERRNPKSERFVKNCPPYDKEARGKVSRALNSTRALAIKDDERVMSIVQAVGGDKAQSKTLDQLDMLNRHRFSWGDSNLGRAMNYLYGKTLYVHLSDAPNSKYKKQPVKFKQRDAKGEVQEVTIQKNIWISGSWKAGDPMIPNAKGFEITRTEDGHLRPDLDLSRQITEVGCPEAFMSIHGGEPGVGKTKLAIACGKEVNAVTQEPILYVNGEDTEENFRMKVGYDAHPDLFRSITAHMLPVQRVCDEVYAIRPRLVIIDSVQTLAEWDKGNRGQKSALMILRALMSDVRAGRPHILLISQLNKQNELKGARDLEHLADCVASVTKVDGRKSVFQVAIERKNRGNVTPLSITLRHTATSVESISEMDEAKIERFDLDDPVPAAIKQGVVDLELSDLSEEESEQTGTEE